MQADIDNLEFLGKSIIALRYGLLVVDLYSSKCYIYPMQSRKKKQLKYINEFCLETDKK